MALGGGNFTSYNKILPGTYMNFVSTASASSSVAQRGVCAVAMPLSWGKEGEFFTVTAQQFLTDSVRLFGYGYLSYELNGLKDLFMNASCVHVYRLGESVKATCEYAEALYGGKAGNNISVKISQNIDDSTLFDVTTYYLSTKKDLQTVKAAEELYDNDFVVFNREKALAAGVYTTLQGGSDAAITGEDYQKFLECAENVSFNVLCVSSEDEGVNKLVSAYTKRMREERGVKFQSVLYKCPADHMGVINVDTPCRAVLAKASDLVWFVAGAAAGCQVNKSLTNMVYDGNFKPDSQYTHSELEEGVKEGKFIIHSVGDQFRVLADINSLVNLSQDLSSAFCENQTVRIIDQIAYDDANLFKTKYLGVVPNDEAGRLSLWNDLTEHRKTLEKIRAIENFKDEDLQVEKGSTKTAVVITGKICPVNSMTYLYITTEIE